MNEVFDLLKKLEVERKKIEHSLKANHSADSDLPFEQRYEISGACGGMGAIIEIMHEKLNEYMSGVNR